MYDGGLLDLIYACVVNNVRGFRAGIEKHFARDFSEIWEHEIIRYINEKYGEIENNSWQGASFRRGVVRSLMKM